MDLNRLGEINLSMRYNGRPVPGGSLSIYKAAAVQWNGTEYLYVATEEFAAGNFDFGDLDSADLGPALADYVWDMGLQPLATNTVDNRGNTTFQNLEPGLYLIDQAELAPGFRPIMPFVVSLPQYDAAADEYDYTVDASPKVDPIRDPSNPSDPTAPSESQPAGPSSPTDPSAPTKPTDPTEPTKPNLPQTGQYNWPVPVLAISGMVLFAAGWMLWVGKRERDEA